MVSEGKKLFAMALVFMFLFSSLAISGMNDTPAVTAVNTDYKNKYTPPILLAYIPSSLHQYVAKELHTSKITYSYSGNLINVNYTYKQGTILSLFNMLNKTLGINYFIFNNSDDFTSCVATPAYQAEPYNPSDIYNAYDMNYIHDKGYYGNNTTIVIVDAYGDPTINYDVSVFDNITGLPPINLNISTPEGTITSTNSGWASETAIDVEWSHAMAPGAKIDLVLSPDDGHRLLDSVEYAVSHRLGNVISLSWGEPESKMTASELASLNSIYKQAAEENITVVAASGDSGANDGTSSPTVNFPAADPYVLGVGGTTLIENSKGQYSQSAWGDSIDSKELASGGGFSSYFSTPYYQIAPNYTETQRGVPDVALDANPNTGVLTIVSGEKYSLGGTSIATPMWAGIIATMDQYYNKSLGLVNPIFYKISETKYYTNAFTQITSGGNYGYDAGPGWNPVTGLGTPLISNLVNDTGIILNGYGTVATFNNTLYATGITADINTGANTVEQYNGSTFYYTGFYANSNNYIKFGITTNETGYYYEYMVYENGTMTTGLIGGGSASAIVGVTISGSEIEFTVNGRTVKELNMPIAFEGNYRAAVGAQQDNARINFVNIPSGTFSRITITNKTGRLQYTGIYQHGYSNVGTSYSNITFSYNNSTDILTAAEGAETNKMIYGNHGPVHINYSINFGIKSTVKFSLSNGTGATYSVNSSSSTSSTQTLGGGYYSVAAKYDGKIISREIYVPYIKTESITVKYTPSYARPEYSLIIDGFFKYSGDSGNIDVYELEGNNFSNISADGYIPSSIAGNIISSITLNPEKVLLNVFVSNGGVNVLFNGNRTMNNGGYHYLKVEPGIINITVNKTGYSTYEKNINLMPAKNKNIYVLLTPLNSSMDEIKGQVENVPYKYNLSNVKIMYDNTTAGYTNQSGQYILFSQKSINITLSEYLYNSAVASVSPGINPVIYMTPANVSVTIINFKITYSIPLGFYFAFVSWDRYPLSNFGEYVIAYSNNPLMLNPRTEVITSMGTDFAFIPGMIPGKTYYVIVDAYSSNGSFISSNEVAVHYNLISYMINFLIFLGLISYIIFIILYFMRRKKRKKALEDWEEEYFKQ